MNPALPRFPSLDLDARRIAATSATIAVHLLALMLLLAPMESAQQAAPVEEPDVIIFEDLPKPPDPPPPPVEPRTITRQETLRPAIVPEVMNIDPAPVDEVLPNLGPVQELATDFGTGTQGAGVAFPTGPLPLTVLNGPAPTYPLAALRQGVEGRVILRIEVDATGRPTGGSIETSSGSRLLDREALKFVLAKWRFEPAMHAGQPIAAVALVPVDYMINR